MKSQNAFNQSHANSAQRKRNTLSRLVGLVCLTVSVGAFTQVKTTEKAPQVSEKKQPEKTVQTEEAEKKQQQQQKSTEVEVQQQEAPVPAPIAPKTSEERVFDLVTEQAKELAAQPYVQPEQNLPAELADMNYQQYRAIRFNPEQAQWKDKAKFEMQLFHPGFLYRSPVEIKVVDDNSGIKNMLFETDRFIYEKDAAPLKGSVPKDAGFAGFRVHYPLKTNHYKDEVAVFLGASYFRLIGPGQIFGISARGLAIDTAEASGEEFPAFTKFWMLEPKAEDTKLVFFALLDSQSVTGAYRFELEPGLNTVMHVQSTIFAREDVKKLGVAPLTSMYLSGENDTRNFDDFRPEVHDSDGLSMHTSRGEWIWRTLNNPKGLRVTSLQDEQPKGFGLLQRDQSFVSYQDTEAHYHERPGMWITPNNQWGKGRVELVEIPTNSETNDNIVSYWVPAQPFKKGEMREFDYTIRSVNGSLNKAAAARVSQVFNSWAALPGQDDAPEKNVRQMVVDFNAEEFAHLSDSIRLIPHLSLSSGSYKDLEVVQLPDKKTWRAQFKLQPENDNAIDMRLYLTLGGKQVSEVWNYVWSANEVE
ncbi:glucan biosynthesis protein [Paraglaciecola chathamensis]|uniref:Glucans biosynthesis protein G n=1 Tax=Paraglaciecola chathamensis S18K6 TaxID=1127672 RepID=A0AAV3UW10_9ALTE|nr:glucan biosynthesis protein G [Paraglaciecola chathamensis]GAC09144.1 periplasmic glucans biosynthesis protein [Paraglaciecola chathamensis S18K6]